jgi:hypothetical protein
VLRRRRAEDQAHQPVELFDAVLLAEPVDPLAADAVDRLLLPAEIGQHRRGDLPVEVAKPLPAPPRSAGTLLRKLLRLRARLVALVRLMLMLDP